MTPPIPPNVLHGTKPLPRRPRAVRLGLLASLWLAPTLAVAAVPPAPKAAPGSSHAAPASGATAKAKKKGKRGKKRIALDEAFEVEGKLEKPSAFYVLRRSSLDNDWARLDARFTPLVLESVQDPLF